MCSICSYTPPSVDTFFSLLLLLLLLYMYMEHPIYLLPTVTRTAHAGTWPSFHMSFIVVPLVWSHTVDYGNSSATMLIAITVVHPLIKHFIIWTVTTAVLLEYFVLLEYLGGVLTNELLFELFDYLNTLRSNRGTTTYIFYMHRQEWIQKIDP